MHPKLLRLAATTLLLAAAIPARAQIFLQGPVETRGYRNPNLAPPAHDHGIETENMFGFTLGSDTDEAGSKTIASENVVRFGYRSGRYTGFGTKLEFANGVTDNFAASFSLLGGYRMVRNVPDLPNIDSSRFDGIGMEFRWRLLDRKTSPFGLTLHVEPALRMADEVSGQRGLGFASENKLIIDRELIKDTLFGTFNLLYDIETFKTYNEAITERASAFGFSTALSVQVAPKLFLGGELRYLRAYEGLALNRFQGHAVFVGPTMFWHITDNAWISFALNAQVAGRAQMVGQALGDNRRLDLVNFNRYQARLKVGMEF